MIRVRGFRRDDAAALEHDFLRAVREGAAGAYSELEREAWANAPHSAAYWCDRLGAEITLVAERGSVISGFMTLCRDATLDMAFVLPEAMGTGVANALHDRVIVEAQALGMTRLTTEASHLARRFFLKQGWRELGAQKIELSGLLLTNFAMEKRLAHL